MTVPIDQLRRISSEDKAKLTAYSIENDSASWLKKKLFKTVRLELMLRYCSAPLLMWGLPLLAFSRVVLVFFVCLVWVRFVLPVGLPVTNSLGVHAPPGIRFV